MAAPSEDVGKPEEPRGASGMDITEGLDAQPSGKPVSRLMVYLIGCGCVTVMGGGIILGSGPFSGAVVDGGFMEGKDVGNLFVVAFQILTWGTVLAAHLLGRLGPRMTALIGVCISLIGIITLATMKSGADKPAAIVVTVAYGLVGAGGNHIYLSTFQFAQLFPETLGLADGVIAGLFCAAGLVLLVLNIPGASVTTIFTIWIFVAAAVFVLILLFYPDKPYSGGDIAVMTWPSLKYAKNPLNFMEYVTNFKYLVNFRYLLFVLSFGWSSCYATWVSGQVILQDNDHTGDEQVGVMYFGLPGSYKQWAQPIAANTTVLFTWIVGGMIDRTGFAITSFMQALFCTSMLVLAQFRHTQACAWANLLFINWINSVLYTQQFVFLHKVFSGDVFTTALLATLVVQGSMLFIASSPPLSNPWGIEQHDGPPSLAFLVLTCVLYIWPLTELLVWRRKDLIEAEDHESLLASRSVLGSVTASYTAPAP